MSNGHWLQMQRTCLKDTSCFATYNEMDTIFMNSENSKIPKPHVLILKLTNK